MALLDRLLEGASGRVDHTSVSALAKRLFRSDPRAAIRAVMQGELPRLLAGPEQEATLDSLQAVMSVIEGMPST